MDARIVGNKIEIKIVVLLAVFLVTCIFVYGYSPPAEVPKKILLSNYFSSIDGYDNIGFIRLPENQERMLDLDDYVFANYKGDSGNANLYIGYYYSANKAYSSHSPMVCYPSQGWKIESDPKSATIMVGPRKINYDEIITSYGDQKELVLYWYQAGLFTNTQVYRNKIDMGYNKLTHNDQQHGFVRISVSMKNRSYEDAKKSAINFIDRFYPKFISFILEK